MAISRILSQHFASKMLGMIIYLSRISPRVRSRGRGTAMRRYPRIKRVGCPPSVLSCTAWGFSCLANYFASGELLPRLFTLACALLPKNRRCLFCDTLRHRNFTTAAPASSTRHTAVWCSDFPPASRKRLTSDHLPSRAIYHNPEEKGTADYADDSKNPIILSILSMNSERRWDRHKENRNHRERDEQFANHSAEISQQTPPACPAGVDHSFPSNEFSEGRADHRSNKQANDSEKDTDERAKDSSEHAPLCRPEIFRTEITTQKIE